MLPLNQDQNVESELNYLKITLKIKKTDLSFDYF